MIIRTAIVCALLMSAASAQPLNDGCSGATPITDGRISYNLASATTSPEAASSCGSATSDLWYSYVSDCDGEISLRGDLTSGNVITLYDDCTSLTEIGCYNTGDGPCIPTTVGTSYIVRVGQAFSVTENEFSIGCSPTVIMNDTCLSAVTVSDQNGGTGLAPSSGTFSGTNPSCGTPGLNDLWFTTTASASGNMTVQYRPSVSSGLLQYSVSVFDSCGGAELMCNNTGGFGANNVELTLAVTSGTAYSIRVGSQVPGSPCAAGTLSVDTVGPLANDFCAGALAAMDDGVPIPVSTQDATPSGVSASCFIGTFNDIWYRVTASDSGTLTAEFELTANNSAMDRSVGVYDACGGTQLNCGMNAVGDLVATTTAGVVAGTDYWVRLGLDAFYPASSGTLTLSVAGVPGGDSCADADPVSDGTVNFATTAATVSGVNAFVESGGNYCTSTSGANPPTEDQWFEYTATCSGQVLFDIAGLTFEAIPALYTDCTNLGLLNCTFSGISSGVQIFTGAEAGDVIYVQIAGQNLGSTGNGALTIVCQSVPIQTNDFCDGATEITSPGLTAISSPAYFSPGVGDYDCQGPGQADLWFQYTPPLPSELTVELVGMPMPTGFVAIWEECPDGTNGAISCGAPAASSGPVAAGDTVYIQHVNSVGFAPLDLDISVTPLLVNDTCALSTAVFDGDVIPVDFAMATDSGAAAYCNALPLVDVWFQYTAIEDGVLGLSASSANEDLTWQVFDACGGTSLACVDNTSFGAAEPLAFAMTTGQQLFFRLEAGAATIAEVSAQFISSLADQHVILAAEDPSGSIDSVQAIEDALMANGILETDILILENPALASVIDPTLGLPATVWFPAGTFPEDLDPSDVPGLAETVRDFVVAGAPTFISGGDLFTFADSGAIRDVDGVDDAIFGDFAADGDDSHLGMTGADIFAGFDNLYSQENVASDFTDQLVVATSDTLGSDTAAVWNDDGTGGNMTAYITGVRYTTAAPMMGDPEPGNVLSVSSEFGGWYQGDAMSQATIMAEILAYFGLVSAPEFIRADVNEDGAFGLSDAIALLQVIFSGAAAPSCADAADINADGGFTLGDVIALLGILFQGAAAPAAPYPDCGPADPMTPSVSCDASATNCP